MNGFRHFSNNRLVYYIPEGTFDWDTHWANLISPSLYRSESQGLGMLSFLSKFLPRNGRILEAGCGTGYIVHELCLQGFKCEGVDTARKTIQKINELVPFLTVCYDDVLNMNCPDNYYSGYISLGVVEHRIEGPEPFFTEAYRVLTHGGTAIFTVPYCNTIRAIKAKIGCYPPPPPKGMVFYQYAFTKKEVIGMLQQSGFTITDISYYDAWKGLKDELWPFSQINKNKKLANICRRLFDQKYFFPHLAHMIAFVCKKD